MTELVPGVTLRGMTSSDHGAVLSLFDRALGRGYVSAADLSGNWGTFQTVGVVAEAGDGSLVAAMTGSVAMFPGALRPLLPVDQVRSVLALTPQLDRPGGALLRSGAVRPDLRRRGIGSAMTWLLLGHLAGAGGRHVATLAWVDYAGCHAANVLERNGFSKITRLPAYWYETSIVEEWECPTCGTPCECAADVYQRPLV
jgi:ribosomal protein S18 acetylase RimI-like enzyme